MDVIYLHRGLRFVWNSEKARSNREKHEVTFEEACEVFFDPVYVLADATAADEERHAAIGITTKRRVLVVVHMLIEGNLVRIISARGATLKERREYEDNGRAHS